MVNKPITPQGTGTEATSSSTTEAPKALATEGFLERLRKVFSTSQQATTQAVKATEKAAQALPIEKVQGPSPLKQQHLEPRSTPRAAPVTLTFLSGDFKGQKMSVGQWLGLAIATVTHELSAEWSERQASGILCGSNFDRLGARTFSLELDFHEIQFDVSHLTEQLALLLRITGSDATPPLLMLKQGDLVARPIFCTRISIPYTEPYAEGRGFRRAVVTLEFKLQAGKNSEHALGALLTSTPLQDIKESQTQQQRERQGVQAVVQELLAPCLGTEGSQQVKQLIDQDKLTDANAVAGLSPQALVQSAIAGMLPKSVLQDEKVKQKLKESLALVMAQSEDGIGAVDGESPRKFASALLSGSPDGLTAPMQRQWETAKPDFALIFDSIWQQKLAEGSPVYDQAKHPTAGARFRKLGSCGITLRQVGAPAIAEPTGDEAKVLKEINTFLGDPKTTPKQIADRFQLQTESQIRHLRNGVHYSSKEEFISHAARQGSGVTGYTLWNRFAAKPEDKNKDKTPATPAAP